jgi:hypothetical protein
MNLAELVGKTDEEIREMADDVLVANLHDAEHAAAEMNTISGRIVAVLKSRYSWSKVAELTGMPQTTLHNRVHPRTSKRTEPDQGGD